MNEQDLTEFFEEVRQSVGIDNSWRVQIPVEYVDKFEPKKFFKELWDEKSDISVSAIEAKFETMNNGEEEPIFDEFKDSVFENFESEALVTARLADPGLLEDRTNFDEVIAGYFYDHVTFDVDELVAFAEASLTTLDVLPSTAAPYLTEEDLEVLVKEITFDELSEISGFIPAESFRNIAIQTATDTDDIKELAGTDTFDQAFAVADINGVVVRLYKLKSGEGVLFWN